MFLFCFVLFCFVLFCFVFTLSLMRVIAYAPAWSAVLELKRTRNAPGSLHSLRAASDEEMSPWNQLFGEGRNGLFSDLWRRWQLCDAAGKKRDSLLFFLLRNGRG